MDWEEKRRNELAWQEELPTENGLYDYKGSLYPVDSDTAIECNPYCRINVRKGDGPRVSIHGLDGQEFDVTRTGEGRWRGPVGPVHIPTEDARRSDGGGTSRE